MGRAILAGLLADHVTVTGGVRVTNRSVERARDFDAEPRVSAWITSTEYAQLDREVRKSQADLLRLDAGEP